MTEWKRCPECGGEYPETAFLKKERLSDERRDVCYKCWRRERDRQRYQHKDAKSHPGKHKRWTRGDDDALDAAVGMRIEDVAERVGRTEYAVRLHIRKRPQLDVLNGRIIKVKEQQC